MTTIVVSVQVVLARKWKEQQNVDKSLPLNLDVVSKVLQLNCDSMGIELP